MEVAKEVLAQIAPRIKEDFDGALAGCALSVIEHALGIIPPNEAGILSRKTEVLHMLHQANLTQIHALQVAERRYRKEMRRISTGIGTNIDFKLSLYQNPALLFGGSILIFFFVISGSVVWAGYELIAKGNNEIIAPEIFELISGCCGALLGYIGANTQQVINYYFGAKDPARIEVNSQQQEMR